MDEDNALASTAPPPSGLAVSTNADGRDTMSDPQTPSSNPPLSRQNTINTDGGTSTKAAETCRICRSEGTPTEPLFYPCKCSGSIKHVHQECLMEWLSHSHKKHCELCKTPFRFTKLYDAQMPQVLPWGVFFKQAAKHAWWAIVKWLRGTLVAFVWLGVLPWFVRWAWRYMFYFADAGFARDVFLRRVQDDLQVTKGQLAESRTILTDLMKQMLINSNTPASTVFNTNNSWVPSLKKSTEWARSLGLEWLTDHDFITTNSTTASADDKWLNFWQADHSLLSSYSWAADLTPSPQANKILLDVFEGQLITATVIVGFILVFLIREWVVQQQPLVNLENANMHLAADGLQDMNDRLQQQNELLVQVRQRLGELRREADEHSRDSTGPADHGLSIRFDGWNALEATMVHANDHLKRGGVVDHGLFLNGAVAVSRQMVAARIVGLSAHEIAERVTTKLNTFADTERKKWRETLIVFIDNTKQRGASVIIGEAEDVDAPGHQAEAEGDDDGVEEPTSTRRPPLERDFSSRVTHVQRLLQEADEDVGDAVNGADSNATSALQTQDALFNEVTNSSRSTPSSRNSRNGANSSIASESQAPAQESSFEPAPDPQIDALPLPITNAGPDARTNIKRATSAKGKRIVVQPPVEELKPLVDDELKGKLEKFEAQAVVTDNSPLPRASEETIREGQTASQTVHMDPLEVGAPPFQDEDSFANRVATAFKEEFGLDEAEELENLRRLNLVHNDGIASADGSPELGSQPQDNTPQLRGPIGKLYDWFWGDLQAATAAEVTPLANEELIADVGVQEAALGVDVNGEAALDPAAQEALAQAAQQLPEHDPEVMAAAQQAGLDADAVEDAEDLEGIFELIGMQGPITGLFQTATFCTVLVTTTVIGAVGLPYVWGKLVLSFIGAPMSFLVKTPLQLASFVTDAIIDITLVLGGWLIVLGAVAMNAIGTAIGSAFPNVMDSKRVQIFMDAAVSTAHASGGRLQNIFVTTQESSTGGWYWAFVSGSCHSHRSLKDLEMEITGLLNSMRATLQTILQLAGDDSRNTVKGMFSTALTTVPRLPGFFVSSAAATWAYLQPLFDTVAGLKSNSLTLTFNSSDKTFDPSLMYWSPADRSMAILVGYISLAGLAAIYVAADTPLTVSESGRRTEKLLRDTLRQAGGVLKVIVIINIEMLLFPFYCGMLLDFAFLPLFENATITTRLAFAIRAPTVFCFVHWITGTAYMFHFALFVGMCRKILRKGVLWFIRDPDDPTFHPVRDVLERNVLTQLRKIAFSALVYGALVILCLGGVVWSIGKLFRGIFPLKWVSTEPILEFPLDLLLYNFMTPIILRMIQPSEGVQAACAWWLKKCARQLRLSHFLFDTRQGDEEHDGKEDFAAHEAGTEAPSFRNTVVRADLREGRFCLTPCNDQYRPPKSGEAYLHVNDTDVYIADADGKRNEHFTVVYVPPRFKMRIAAFMVCLWMFTAFTGLSATLLPLAFGRAVLGRLMKKEAINDIYAYTTGAYVVGSIAILGWKWSALYRAVVKQTPAVNVKAAADRIKSILSRILKCCYVYGFLALVLPSLLAFLLHFYFILPLHTYAASIATHHASNSSTNGAIAVVSNVTDNAAAFLNNTYNSTNTFNRPSLTPAGVVEHSFHVLQNYALGLLYIRIASRFIMTAPTSRAAEAFRRITEPGYLNPDARLATRFVILPSILLAAFALVLPLGIAQLAIFTTLHALKFQLTSLERTKLYRYAYPMAAGWFVAALGTLELGKATGRWRAKIRDEVYLVGERLHNFGEKKPPEGSKSVVRRER